MRPSVLAIDVGGTKIAVARVENTGRITHQLVASTPPEGGMAVIAAITDLLQQVPGKGIGALGIDVPGLAEADGSVWAPNISGWEHLPVKRLLSRRLRLPVLVESDRSAFVTGEAWQGAAQNCRDVIFLAIGTGIGAGIISGGRLIRGHGELAGCIGWMAVRDQFLPAYQEVGCLESHVAGPGLAREAQRIFKRVTSTRELVKMARRGEPRAKKVFAQAGHWLGLALANLVDTLSPEMIVIGGGVAAAGNLLLDPARATMQRWAQPLAVKHVRITRSRLGNRAGLLGAAKLAFDHFQL
ncbi:MAG: ROK family protein [Terriglobia bacterium]